LLGRLDLQHLRRIDSKPGDLLKLFIERQNLPVGSTESDIGDCDIREAETRAKLRCEVLHRVDEDVRAWNEFQFHRVQQHSSNPRRDREIAAQQQDSHDFEEHIFKQKTLTPVACQKPLHE
jgi:hypothetical protein